MGGCAAGVASVRGCQELLPMSDGASSKTDLAEAEAISDGGDASGVTRFIRGGNPCWDTAAGRKQ